MLEKLYSATFQWYLPR